MDEDFVNIVLDDDRQYEHTEPLFDIMNAPPFPLKPEARTSLSEPETLPPLAPLDHVTETWMVFLILTFISVGIPYLLFRRGNRKFRRLSTN